MSRNNNRNRRKYSRSQINLYVLSFLIIISMVLGSFAGLLGTGF
jgi:hypothetical protein